MATASIGSLEGLPLPDLLVLVRQAAERARICRILNPRAAMFPDEVMEAKVLYSWPGDLEAAFFALYDGLQSTTVQTPGKRDGH